MPDPVAILAAVLAFVDDTPDAEDVKAGWLAMLIFVLLVAAVVSWTSSFVKRLRNAGRAAAEGRYDPSPRDRTDRPAD